MPRKRTTIVELLKTVAVVALLAALVCLCTIYMLSYQAMGGYTFTKYTMTTLSGESMKYQYADYFDASFASPKFVGFSARVHGENIGFHCLGGENDTVASSLVPFYERLFDEEGTVTALTEEEGAQLFSSLLGEDHIYAVYENDLPKSLIYALATEDAAAREISDEYIREIVIVADEYLYSGVSMVPAGVQVYTEIFTFYAVARDSMGNYYRYDTSFVPQVPTDISFNTNYYLTYTTEESYFYYEYADLFEKDAYFGDGLALFATDTTAVLSATHGKLPHRQLSFSTDAPDKEIVNALLGALLMNPEMVTSFTDGNGVRFYYDEGCNASFSPDGVLEYTAHEEEGLSLSELFEYRTQEERYDARDYVGASLVLLRALEKAAHGEQSAYTPVLSRVLYDGNTTTVTFGYAVDGLPIYLDGNGEVLSLEFEGGILKRVSYLLRSVSASYFDSSAADMMWDLRIAAENGMSCAEYAYAYFLEEEELSGAVLVGRSMGEAVS